MINYFKSIFQKFDRWVRSRYELPKGSITFSDVGFSVEFRGRHSRVEWSQVNRINAFKRDLFSVDLICLEFHQEGVEAPVEIDEEMDGYAVLKKILPDKFEGFDRDWWPKVAHPAFATNFSKLWARK